MLPTCPPGWFDGTLAALLVRSHLRTALCRAHAPIIDGRWGCEPTWISSISLI
jgi:hypothetical protein